MSTTRKLAIALIIALSWGTAMHAAFGEGLRAPPRKPVPAIKLSPAEERAAAAVLAADRAAKAAKAATAKARKAKVAARAQVTAAKAAARLTKAQLAAQAAERKAAAKLRASEQFTSCLDSYVGAVDEDEAAQVCLDTVSEAE